MFCENCGKRIDSSHKFCDYCGKVIPVMPSDSNLKLTKKHMPKNVVGLLCLFFLVIAASYAYANYQKQTVSIIQKQAEQTQQLQDQVDQLKKQTESVQQQNSDATKSLTEQLGAQKDQTDKAVKQAQLAQQALAISKEQSQTTTEQTSNNFPSIDTRAIVLIVCFDSSGNLSQSGSGTIVKSDGYVLTNKHVVTNSNGDLLSCGAFINDGSSSPALNTSVIYSLSSSANGAGFYPGYDAALLKIDGALNTQTQSSEVIPSSFPYITPEGGNLKQGDSLFIFGYPGASNLVFNVSRGIVSSFSTDGLFINTDAIIDHGNSGGAAITSDGRFVGIPTQKYQSNGDYLGQILKVEHLNIN